IFFFVIAISFSSIFTSSNTVLLLITVRMECNFLSQRRYVLRITARRVKSLISRCFRGAPCNLFQSSSSHLPTS
ncbi:hypothetical protein BGZ60DRAFT_416415, partial [Tricladium varicosporioides]